MEGMESGDSLRLTSLGRPELGVTFTKIHCWTLTQYSKCVFLDADTLVSAQAPYRVLTMATVVEDTHKHTRTHTEPSRHTV